MIYIKRLDTCFLRIPKSGSQSLQVFLQDNVIDVLNDVIARPIDVIKDNPQSYDDVNINFVPVNTNIHFETAHVTAQFVIDKGLCTPDTKFIGLVRNPFEKQISHYTYRVAQNIFQPPKSGDDFILNFRNAIKTGMIAAEQGQHHLMKQVDYFKYNGKLLDTAEPWLLDDLPICLDNFCKRYNIEIKIPLRHINKTAGDKKYLVDVLYTDELKQKVYDLYKEDFELHNNLKGL